MTEPSFGTTDPDPHDPQDVQPETTQTDEQPHEVKTNPSDPRQARTLFSGTFKDALRYLRDNFPRPHVEPGGGTPIADAVLHAPDGSVYAHHGDGAVGADENGLVKQEGTQQ